MKTTIIGMLSTLLICCTLTSCSDKGRMEALEKENAELKAKVMLLDRFVGKSSQGASKFSPYPHIDSAKAAIDSFRQKPADGKILIPAALYFKISDFATLLANVKSDVTIAGFRFYPILHENHTTNIDTLKMAGVPVDDEGNDLLIIDDEIKVFDFADHCPTVCTKTDNDLFMSNYHKKFYTYKKSN